MATGAELLLSFASGRYQEDAPLPILGHRDSEVVNVTGASATFTGLESGGVYEVSITVLTGTCNLFVPESGTIGVRMRVAGGKEIQVRMLDGQTSMRFTLGTATTKWSLRRLR